MSRSLKRGGGGSILPSPYTNPSIQPRVSGMRDAKRVADKKTSRARIVNPPRHERLSRALLESNTMAWRTPLLPIREIEQMHNLVVEDERRMAELLKKGLEEKTTPSTEPLRVMTPWKWQRAVVPLTTRHSTTPYRICRDRAISCHDMISLKTLS